VIQQTRHYDNKSDTTKALRSKEEAHDYRYFPEPDLVPILMDAEVVKNIGKSIPELPAEKSKRYQKDLGLNPYDAGFMAGDAGIASYFDKCLKYYDNAKAVANWIMGDFSALANKKKVPVDRSKVTPENLCNMLKMIDSGKISSKIAKTVFEEMFDTGNDPESIIKAKGLEQISDSGELKNTIEQVIADNPGPVGQYREGKKKAIGFLIGQVMAKTRGKANPKLVNEIMTKKLG